MPELELIIGSKRTSSWSLRPWLALRHAGLPFAETVIDFRKPDRAERIRAASPSARVPVLRHGEMLIWESLAICEYAADLAPGAGLWPEDVRTRAAARAVSCEMHAGFASLRQALPMDIGPTGLAAEITPAVAADITRIQEIWAECRGRFGQGGPFLFGRFSIADAMFAPVVTRFTSYTVEVTPVARAYMDAVWALPAMQAWKAAAALEGAAA